VVFIAVGLSVDASIGLAAGTFSDKVLHRPRFRRRLERASAVVFGGLAVRLVVDAR
jgi:threonine/homoserine/homoserine lactone efflux protein